MRYATYGFAILFALLVGTGCEDVPVPFGSLEIRSIAISNSGVVAVVAHHPNGLGHVWVREDFTHYSWRPIAHSQQLDDLRVCWRGSELLMLRDEAGRRDLWRVNLKAHAYRLTQSGDIYDVAACGSMIAVLRFPRSIPGPWRLETSSDGVRWEPLAELDHVVAGTLALYELPTGPRLYWGELGPDWQSAICRMDPSSPDTTETVLTQPAHRQILGHPIILLRPDATNISWLAATAEGPRAFCRRLEQGQRVQEMAGPELGAGAASANRQWAVSWDRVKRELTRTKQD